MDWWACGLTFYACTVREHLFNGADKDAIFQRILGAPLDLGKLEQHSVLLMDLVEKLLVRDPSLRLGTEGMRSYPTLLYSDPNITLSSLVLTADRVETYHYLSCLVYFYQTTLTIPSPLLPVSHLPQALITSCSTSSLNPSTGTPSPRATRPSNHIQQRS